MTTKKKKVEKKPKKKKFKLGEIKKIQLSDELLKIPTYAGDTYTAGCTQSCYITTMICC
jgi:hypothetical protein